MVSPRQLQQLFLAVTLLFAAAVGWLGWRLLDQDRALARQRRMEQLEAAADRLAGALYRRLGELEEAVGGGALPHGAVRVRAKGTQFEIQPEDGLLYFPETPEGATARPEAFAASEDLEFRRNDPAGAVQSLKALTGSSDASVRAEALVRLGRNLRKAGRTQEALRAYRDLALMKEARVLGLPAELVAMEARCALLEHADQRQELKREAGALLRKLADGEWRLSHAEWESQWEQAERWSGLRSEVDRDKAAISAALEQLWETRKAGRGHRILQASQAVIAAWSSDGREWSMVLMPASRLSSVLAIAIPFSARLTDTEGRDILGGAVEGKLRVERSQRSIKQPWSLELTSIDDGTGEILGRSWLLGTGFVLLVMLLGGVGYMAARAASKEMTVAQLQADFVAAVSHEFRSPLSSISQISELLNEDRWPTPEHRKKGYEILGRESARLRRLVEELLDFARMEAGTAAYKLDRLDASELIHGLVEEQREGRIELRIASQLPAVRADREALARAVGNLIENALKYSAPESKVRLEVEPEGGLVAIRVRDEGVGIPEDEQPRVFDKFYRGRDAKERKVKGTGIGLAMVRHIVEGHGGEIRLESTPGVGSTFTILLRGEKER